MCNRKSIAFCSVIAVDSIKILNTKNTGPFTPAGAIKPAEVLLDKAP